MTNNKLNLYYFGETGVYDEYSPTYVYNKRFVPEVLYQIAVNEPFTTSGKEIAATLEMSDEVFNEVIYSLNKIKAIQTKNDGYKINFPIFLEQDICVLEKLLNEIGERIGNLIIEMKELIYYKISFLSSYEQFSKERILYHIICDAIFDGTAIDFFGEHDLFCISKVQPDNRDYLIIGYEESHLIEKHSLSLLCSSNNYRSNDFVFNSFGDSNGNRKDMYRVFKQTQQALEKATLVRDVNLTYMKILNDKNKDIVNDCGELFIKISDSKLNYDALTEKEKSLVEFLINLDYVSLQKESNELVCQAILFKPSDMVIIEQVSDLVLEGILSVVRAVFIDFKENNSGLTAIKHGVDIKEIANELWHQIFGSTNEYLVQVGFVACPQHKEGEGRYFRSVKVLKQD